MGYFLDSLQIQEQLEATEKHIPPLGIGTL